MDCRFLLPRKPSLRLPDYDYSQPGYYFVTVCTYRRQALFSGFVGAHLCVRPALEGNFILSWLYELEHKYPHIEIDSSCVMPDHIHAILRILGGHIGPPLPEIVKWYKTQTTNTYIQKIRAGELPPFEKHVWQRGYHDHIIRNERDLYETRRYIQENPLKWGIK